MKRNKLIAHVTCIGLLAVLSSGLCHGQTGWSITNYIYNSSTGGSPGDGITWGIPYDDSMPGWQTGMTWIDAPGFFGVSSSGTNTLKCRFLSVLEWRGDHAPVEPFHVVHHSLAAWHAQNFGPLGNLPYGGEVSGSLQNNGSGAASSGSSNGTDYEQFAESWSTEDVTIPQGATYYTYTYPSKGQVTTTITPSPNYVTNVSSLVENDTYFVVSDLRGYSTHNAPKFTGDEWPSGWDPKNPKYFSGTGCEVIATPIPPCGDLMSAVLKIGGVQVASFTPNAGDHYTHLNPPPPIKVMFDSTHFKDGITIPIELDVTDEGGKEPPVPIAGTAYNRAHILNNSLPEFVAAGVPGTVGYIASDFSRINYTAPGCSQAKPSILLDFLHDTAFEIITHANYSGFDDCFSNKECPPDGFVKFDSYTFFNGNILGNPAWPIIVTDNSQPTLHDKIGQRPPSVPPTNFVFIDGCNTASGDMTVALGVPSADRIILGWQEEVYISSENNFWRLAFFGNLSNGYTFQDAEKAGLAASGARGVNDRGVVVYPMLPTTVGDPQMKLHGVYLAGSPSTSWFIQI